METTFITTSPRQETNTQNRKDLHTSPDDPEYYLYQNTPNIIIKMKFTNMLSNFTCNEFVMIQLLRTTYIEHLEKRIENHETNETNSSILTQLLVSLLNKDYNVELIQACTNKIISLHIEDPILILPLIALLKDGNLYTISYSFRALTILSKKYSKLIYEYGGINLAIYHLYIHSNEELLESSIDMCIECINNDTILLFSHTLFIKRLVYLMNERIGTQRYRSTLLSKISSLILKLSHIPCILDLLFQFNCQIHFIDIISKHKYYYNILLQITAALGTMYVNAGNKMFNEPDQNTLNDTNILVQTLAHYTNCEQLQLCLNILIILNYIIK
jgi:hypothetical protein